MGFTPNGGKENKPALTKGCKVGIKKQEFKEKSYPNKQCSLVKKMKAGS